MHAIIPRIAIGSTSDIETSLSCFGVLGCIAEPALVWDLETGCGLIWVTVWVVLCTWYRKGRGYFPQKKRMTLPHSSNEPENGLEAFPICKEAHPSCPIQAVILSGLVLSCYTGPFSPQLVQRSKANNNRATAFITCTAGICQCCFDFLFYAALIPSCCAKKQV